MSFEGKALGTYGEKLALKYLQNKGFKIVKENLKLFCGEIDLLMTDKKTLVIVEVKTKTGGRFGTPQEMVNYKKRQKLRQLARALGQKFPVANIRIDVVAINEEDKSIEHIINAVEGN